MNMKLDIFSKGNKIIQKFFDSIKFINKQVKYNESIGIFFWMRFCEIFEPILGKNFYINIIADNTYSIMINHSLSQDIIRTIFFFINSVTFICSLL